MLFPELSRSNKHGMSPSLNFARGFYRRIAYRNKRNKVFVIGFHKTGTTSLAKALQILGYRVCGFVTPQSFLKPETHPAEVVFEHAYKPLLPHYDAFEDTMWFLFYKQLHAQFPDAHFILTHRPEDAWYNSMVKHFGGFDRRLFRWIYDGIGDPLLDKNLYLNTYKKHNAEVMEYFKSSNNFMVMNMPGDFKWEPLCRFLGCNPPLFGEFPHANSAAERASFSRKVLDHIKSRFYQYELEQKGRL